MAYVRNSTNLKQVDGGFLVKQGDVASTFAFSLLDENHEPISAWRTRGIYHVDESKEQLRKTQSWQMVQLLFNLGMILPAGLYQIEVSVGIYIRQTIDSNPNYKPDKNLAQQRKFTL